MLKLVSSLGFALAAANVKERIRAAAARGILGVAGVVVLVIALCFLLVAAHLWISELINPIASAAIIGGVLLVVALVLFLLASRPIGPGKGAAQTAAETTEKLRESAARMGDALGLNQPPLNNPVLIAAGLALILGFLLGRRGSRRDD